MHTIVLKRTKFLKIMKTTIKFLTVLFLFVSTSSFAQVKLAHINSQEIVALMPEMDSANVKLEKYGKELSDQMQDMQKEFQTKYETYQQKSATWTAAVLESKQKELQDMLTRLEQFQQNAQQTFQMEQQKYYAPIYKKANEAITKVAKAGGYTYVIDLSAGAVIYVDDANAKNISDDVKRELSIPLDKKLPQQQQQPAN